MGRGKGEFQNLRFEISDFTRFCSHPPPIPSPAALEVWMRSSNAGSWVIREIIFPAMRSCGCGCAHHEGLVGDVIHDSGFGGDGDVIPDAEVSDDAGLAADDGVVADAGAARNSHEGDQQSIRADFGGVADGDEVAHLGAAVDDRAADGGALNRDIGAQLDIIADDHISGGGDFVVDAIAGWHSRSHRGR